MSFDSVNGREALKKIERLHYENMGGLLIRRDGALHWYCPACKTHGESKKVRKTCPKCYEVQQ